MLQTTQSRKGKKQSTEGGEIADHISYIWKGTCIIKLKTCALRKMALRKRKDNTQAEQKFLQSINLNERHMQSTQRTLKHNNKQTTL